MHKNPNTSKIPKRAFFVDLRWWSNNTVLLTTFLSKKIFIVSFTYSEVDSLKGTIVLIIALKLFYYKITQKLFIMTHVVSLSQSHFSSNSRLDGFKQENTHELYTFDWILFCFDPCNKVLIVQNLKGVLTKMIWLAFRDHFLPLLQASYHPTWSELKDIFKLVKENWLKNQIVDSCIKILIVRNFKK